MKKIVKDYEWLTVDTEGTCYSTRSGKLYSMPHDKDGYIRVASKVNKKGVKCYAHRAVAIAFIPNPENKSQVNHKNSIRDDNRVENLEWCTPQENFDHGVEFGFIKSNLKGEEAFNNIHSEESVRIICEYLQLGYRLIDIIRLLPEVNRSLIEGIKYRTCWVNISKEYTFSSGKKYGLSLESAHWVCKQLSLTSNMNEIERLGTISRYYISLIKNKKLFYNISSEYTFKE